MCKSHYKMSGLVLNNDSVIRAMESDVGGVFIPVSLNKDDSYNAKSSIASLEQLGAIYSHVQNIIKQMGESLHQGKIDANPLFGDNLDACKYCDYSNICGISPADKHHEATKLDKEEVLSILTEDDQQESAGETSER